MPEYLSGFANEHSTEALKGALPINQANPQKAPFGLYAEQLTGSAFTAPITSNLRTWYYRIRPSVLQSEFQRMDQKLIRSAPNPESSPSPNQMRWQPLPYSDEPKDFIESWVTMITNGSVGARSGMAAHLYAANANMDKAYFYNSDGELLIVPQEGRLEIFTENGLLEVEPAEICIIPRGIKFTVKLPDKKARGYICENYGAPFKIPDRGPIGANSMAAPRHFLYPKAKYEEKKGSFRLKTKFQGAMWEAEVQNSPLDVVAWYGNYSPYKYDLRLYNTIGSISFDHPDPSIFTVITSQTLEPGTANCDFVIFPPRWMVAKDTFRPPYYHRNVMSEFMGLIEGVYDAKQEGFVPGGSSLHNCMSSHGPDAETFEKATNDKLKPDYYENTLAFMFESNIPFQATAFALDTELRERDYLKCWEGLKANFKKK